MGRIIFAAGSSKFNLYPFLAGLRLCLGFYLKGDFLNKGDLIKEISKRTSLDKNEAGKLIDLFFSEITRAMVNGERVEIRGFCIFFIKEYDGYSGRNPKTGKKVQVPAKKLPFFKVGKELKDGVDYPAE